MNDQLRPSTPSTYDDVHALTGAYAVDAVDDIERARFERHLDSCSDCRAEVASLQAAASQLAHLAQAMPPALLRDRVLSDIAAVRPFPPEVPVRPSAPTDLQSESASRPGVTRLAERRQRRGGPRWLAVAAAVVLVGGGVGVGINQLGNRGSQGQSTVATRVLADPAASRHSTQFPGGASAEVVTSTSQGRAVIVTKNLTDAPSGKVYQLWFERGGAFYSAGLMSHDADQVTVLDGNANGATAVGITEEPEGGSPQPTTAPLALISLA